MKTYLAIFCVGMVLSVPGAAHHSFAAEFDSSKLVTFKGTVQKLDWINPHARLYVDVEAESGKVTTWEFELASPNSLMRARWNRNTVKPGELITVESYLAKDGSQLANAHQVWLANGQKVFAGASYFEEITPQKK